VVHRTVIASLLPFVPTTDSVPVIHFLSEGPRSVGPFIANLNSLVFDFVARQKIGGNHLRFFTFKQLPVLPPLSYSNPSSWTYPASKTTHFDWLLPRVLELTYTAWDLLPFAEDVLPALGEHPYATRFTGHVPPPFRWDEARRFLLRCELDAAYFHLYGIARDDVDYIMETFPIVKRKDVAAHGEYRTKRVILEVYDAMQQAMDSGKPYQTRLDPPPADPSVAHVGEPPAWVEVGPSTNAVTNALISPPKSVAVPGTPKPATAGPSAPARSPSSPEPKASVPESKRSEGPPIPVMPPPQGTYAEKFSRIMALKRKATPEAIGEIVAALGDEDEKVRWLASSTLASVKDERVVMAVQAFVERTESAAGREAAEQLLVRSRSA
jgi:hypothetical protein